MIRQIGFTLRPRSRGFHPITDEIEANLPPLPAAGLLHLFIKHTSAGLTLNENADPDVRTDLEAIFDRLVREREAYYIHTYEGDGTPLPSFCGEPRAVSICGSQEDFTAAIWYGLNAENRVSLFTAFIDRRSGEVTTRIVNRNQNLGV